MTEPILDPAWCGHLDVSLRTWTCADCDRPATPEMRARMESAPTKAPEGEVWVLLDGNQDGVQEGVVMGCVLGVYADRAKIAARLLQGRLIGLDDLRARMEPIHWYQGAINHNVFEGWEEGEARDDPPRVYCLRLERIE
jgi:hypothetical protein